MWPLFAIVRDDKGSAPRCLPSVATRKCLTVGVNCPPLPALTLSGPLRTLVAFMADVLGKVGVSRESAISSISVFLLVGRLG